VVLEVSEKDQFEGPIWQIGINSLLTNFFVRYARQEEELYRRSGPVEVLNDKGVFRFGNEFQLQISSDKQIIQPYKVCIALIKIYV
jgi:hypothetical protein